MTQTPKPLSIEIAQVDPSTSAMRAMFELLDEHNHANTEVGQCRWATLEELKQPNCVVLGAWAGPRLCGVGAVSHELGYSEIKRMFVDPDCRGAGVADALLEALQAHALSAGNGRLCLETSSRFLAAVAFYRKQGFQECEPFGKYTLCPVNLYMTRPYKPTQEAGRIEGSSSA